MARCVAAPRVHPEQGLFLHRHFILGQARAASASRSCQTLGVLMHTASRWLCLWALSSALPAGAVQVAGDWAYTSTKADAAYGEPEHLFISVQVIGKKVCGRYMSAYRGGMKVAEGKFHGTVGADQLNNHRLKPVG